MALTNARDILNKKILGNGGGGGDIPSADEIPIDIEGLSATKLSVGLEEILGDIGDVSTSVSTLGGKVEDLEDANNYSTTEQIVGKWIDGSDVYEKTYNNLSVTVNIGDAWNDTGISNSIFDKIIDCKGYDETGQFYSLSAAFLSTTHTIGVTIGNNPSERILNCITFRYIKPAPSPEPTESKKKTTKKKIGGKQNDTYTNCNIIE